MSCPNMNSRLSFHLQSSVEAIQGINRCSAFVQAVPTRNYLFTEKCCFESVLNLTLFNFHLCPRVRDDLSKVKNLLKSTKSTVR